MRAAIQQLFEEDGITVYQPYSTTSKTRKPYYVLKMENDLEAKGGRFDQFEIWPYTAKGSFVTVDEHVDAIKEALDGKTIELSDGRRIYMEYVRTGPDFYDQDLAANTRSVRFRVPTR
jgi:hypothetical protein